MKPTAAQRAWIGMAAAALAVVACQRKPEPAPAPKPVATAPAPTKPAGPPPPLSFRQSTPDAEVSLTLPPAVAKIPALYGKLYADGRNGLQAFADGAKGDIEEQRANGDKPTPYRQAMAYTVSAETPRLIGLQLAMTEDTGAAHPNTSLKGLIWDKVAGREIAPSALFAPGADLTAADKALCDAIHAAKQTRRGDPALSGDLTACPRLKDASLTLAASTTPGKLGGVVAMFSAFALSGGADSGYRIPVPLDAIRTALAPAYAGEFAGTPAPGAGDKD